MLLSLHKRNLLAQGLQLWDRPMAAHHIDGMRLTILSANCDVMLESFLPLERKQHLRVLVEGFNTQQLLKHRFIPRLVRQQGSASLFGDQIAGHPLSVLGVMATTAPSGPHPLSNCVIVFEQNVDDAGVARSALLLV